MSSHPLRRVVRLRGWSKGFRTIDLMRLIRRQAHVELGEAKRLVELVLVGETVSLAFSSEDAARAFLEAAMETGVGVELDAT